MQAPAGTAAVSRQEGPFLLGREEPTYYYINFLALFRTEFSCTTIRGWAEEAAAGRASSIETFDRRLRDAAALFNAERDRTGARPVEMPEVTLNGWESVGLADLRARHGNFLVALFHYGAHREVFLDLASMGQPFVAPVAKHAYFGCTELTSSGPADFENAMRLLAVEDARVGRQLLTGLRQGRLGLIYVDGNMGPEGDRVEEGAVEVDFLGCRIRVKAGISRLAQALKLPVLPLLVDRPTTASRTPVVRAGRMLAPPAGGTDRQEMMQALYGELAEAVRRDPAGWEFGFCLHRWVKDPGPTSSGTPASTDAALTLHPSRVALLSREDHEYWVLVERQRAYALPAWARGLHEWLASSVASPGQVREWLVDRGAGAGEAEHFLSELLARGLLATADAA